MGNTLEFLSHVQVPRNRRACGNCEFCGKGFGGRALSAGEISRSRVVGRGGVESGPGRGMESGWEKRFAIQIEHAQAEASEVNGEGSRGAGLETDVPV